VSGDKILVGLAVTGTRDGTRTGRGTGETSRWQVLTVRDGRIAAIEGFDDRDEAAAWARTASA
jgi:ketosteroid isomerase-like protein